MYRHTTYRYLATEAHHEAMDRALALALSCPSKALQWARIAIGYGVQAKSPDITYQAIELLAALRGAA